MKSKKLVYVLLIVALIVWGVIVYRIVGAFKSDDSAALPSIKTPVVVKKDSTPKDFKIVADYRDPFLGAMVKKEVRAPSTVKPVQKATPVSVLQWPQIKFGGTIRNQQSKQPLALVTIDGKEKIIKEKETIFEVMLSRLYKDSAEFVYKNEKKIIRK